MAGLLPTPNPSVLPLPFQLTPTQPPPLGWSPIQSGAGTLTGREG